MVKYIYIKKIRMEIIGIKITFTLNSLGYLYCVLSNENNVQRGFTFHRLMYYFYNQEWDIFNKKLLIDHIDRNKLNNNIENLRPATTQQNAFNTAAKGCSYHKKSGKWQASIRINGKLIYLGLYDTEEEGHAKYLEAKEIHHIF
jgi:hypothetical protein